VGNGVRKAELLVLLALAQRQGPPEAPTPGVVRAAPLARAPVPEPPGAAEEAEEAEYEAAWAAALAEDQRASQREGIRVVNDYL